LAWTREPKVVKDGELNKHTLKLKCVVGMMMRQQKIDGHDTRNNRRWRSRKVPSPQLPARLVMANIYDG